MKNWTDLGRYMLVLKKICQNLKNYHFLAQLVQKWGPHEPHPKEKYFFAEITKTRSYKLSKTFYIIKISYVLAEL